jgi:3-hydroxybutyryl-CoA dehydrogenase
LCTIINEACHAISEGISDAEQIDIAMKLGTNYPDGPIHWGRRIGASRINELLEAMSAEDKRYTPHKSLLKLMA